MHREAARLFDYIMSTYPSPVTLAEFQNYLKDPTPAADVLPLYARCLDAATEYVYTWLDRDYTASATKTDTFFGDGSRCYAPRNRAGTLTNWTATDDAGTITTIGAGDLLIRANGYLIQISADSTKAFDSGYEHAITYTQPSTLVCPETVKQVITEIAALYFVASNQGEGILGVETSSQRDGSLGYTGGFSERERYADLTERHKEMLRPYKRYPI